jgi:uncharacterized protein
MSQENVEVVRAAIDAFNRAGVAGVEEVVASYSADVQFHEDPMLPEAGIYVGVEAVRNYVTQFLDAFESYKFEIEEVFDADDKVLVFNRQRGRGKGSGAPVEMRNAWLFVLRERKIIQIRPYWDRGTALEALGLSEQDAHADS